MEKLHLVIIDPQRDFCDPMGALAVPGADEDMRRLASLIYRIGPRIHDIHCTLDTHHYFDIAHPGFWMDPNGSHPAPCTVITGNDVEKGVWRATNPVFQDYGRKYVAQLEANDRYPLCIWPPHCLIGTDGHTVAPDLMKALLKWEREQAGMVDFVTKGSNFKTEHYSAVQADVPDPDDPTTLLNMRLIQALEQADMIFLAGEASSHCLKFTVEDVADTFDEKHVRKMTLLTDCCSPVAGFEKEAEVFIQEMEQRGMQTAKSDEVFISG